MARLVLKTRASVSENRGRFFGEHRLPQGASLSLNHTARTGLGKSKPLNPLFSRRKARRWLKVILDSIDAWFEREASLNHS